MLVLVLEGPELKSQEILFLAEQLCLVVRCRVYIQHAESTDKREVMQRSEQKVEMLEAEKRVSFVRFLFSFFLSLCTLLCKSVLYFKYVPCCKSLLTDRIIKRSLSH